MLVTAVGRRCYVIEELLRQRADGDRLLVSDAGVHAPALATDGAEPFLSPPGDDFRFTGWLTGLCERERVDAVLSLHDYEAIRIGEALQASATARAVVIGAPSETGRLWLDKLDMAAALVARGVPTPATWALDAVPDRAPGDAELGFVVKDRQGSGSSGLRFVARWEDVLALRDSLKAPDASIVQSRMPGAEYNVDLFLDRAGDVSAHCIKLKLGMRGGETDAAEIGGDQPPDALRTAIEAVRGMGVTGNVDIDIIDSPAGGLQVIDINPRFGGGYAFSRRVGYPAARYCWLLAKGQPIPRWEGNADRFVGAKYIDVCAVALSDRDYRRA